GVSLTTSWIALVAVDPVVGTESAVAVVVLSVTISLLLVTLGSILVFLV
uniref:Uncharacterized protein n=1 Tax=Amphimedon queenslandica TaxID=400682 RepID=A0A1X7VVK0_AMPQE